MTSFLCSHLIKISWNYLAFQGQPVYTGWFTRNAWGLWASYAHPKNFWLKKWEENNTRQTHESWERRKWFVLEYALPLQTQLTLILSSPCPCVSSSYSSFPLSLLSRFGSVCPSLVSPYLVWFSFSVGSYYCQTDYNDVLHISFIREEKTCFKIWVLQTSYVFICLRTMELLFCSFYISSKKNNH